MDDLEVRQRLRSFGVSDGQASAKAKLFTQAVRSLRDTGASGAESRFWFVPGRIEFLGKHTDYGGGRSLICALERGLCVAASARVDSLVRITDAGRGDRVEFGLSPDLIPRSGHWSNYPITVASRIAQNFLGGIRGADIAFISDLPPAAGLSSSSALVVAIFAVLARVNALDQRDEYKREISSLEDLAGYVGTIENGQSFGSLRGSKGVGTFGGSQDHTAILCCSAGELSEYSFCPVRRARSLTLPRDYVFVIGVSGVTASKTGDALEKYNRVSRLATEALTIWQRETGRKDPTLMSAVSSSADAIALMRKALNASGSAIFTTQALLDRVNQFVVECTEIIPAVVQALSGGDMDSIGVLIDRSQDGAERLLGNQVEETIALARLARELGAVAASAFGAGFGGSVWALVKTEHAESFKSNWSQRYWSRFPELAVRSEFFLTGAGPSMVEFAERR